MADSRTGSKFQVKGSGAAAAKQAHARVNITGSDNDFIYFTQREMCVDRAGLPFDRGRGCRARGCLGSGLGRSPGLLINALDGFNHPGVILREIIFRLLICDFV